jgi:nitrogenase molybdenum-cofactor synthesis protein NifE
MTEILKDRASQVQRKGETPFRIDCEKRSAAGSVTQRACVFCGSRVVLYPIADALHLVHGPLGCAAYTWDIRGALSSGPQLHRLSFSTDLREKDVIHGGEKKLLQSLRELIDGYAPKAAFVYSTCIVGLIGDDIGAVCRQVEKEKGIPVIPVFSEGFAGTKKDGYKAACDAMARLVGTGSTENIPRLSINLLGEFNLAGESWMIRDYYARMGVEVVAIATGDGRVDDIRRMHGASLNVVQCSGSTTHLARHLESRHGTPFIRASYFGIEDTAKALYDVAAHFGDDAAMDKARGIVSGEMAKVMPALRSLRRDLEGKSAAVYVGGAFKAFSLVRALRTLGMRTTVVGSQTGGPGDYEQLAALCDPGTVIVDDTNPLELCGFVKERGCDLLIGGVKERPIAHKLGLAFCDHNHERRRALAGFEGMLNFAREVHASVMSPVWRFVPRPSAREEVS